MKDMHNVISLIGMPGAGKSTIGVLLAKVLGMAFTDTDLLIQQGEGKLLSQIIAEKGIVGFRQIEEQYILGVNEDNLLIATGGSVVYSDKATGYLKAKGPVIFLFTDQKTLQDRLGNLDDRGVIRAPGQTLEMIYNERLPLYRKYADITIDCSQRTPDEIVQLTIQELKDNPSSSH